MRGALAQFLVAAAQSHTQFVLQLQKVRELVPYINEFSLQSAPHRRAWLETASAQI
jgi:hypothetical protein